MIFFFLLGTFAHAALPLEVGSYHGGEVRGTRLFSAIAYAKPPVDALRWQAPLPENAERQAPHSVACPSVVNDYLPSDPIPFDEDCLYLNVWAPSDGGEHPVIFLIHGGGGMAGGGLKSFYDGSVFARAGVVLVAVNYRLGELGWGPKKETAPGSLGLLDQGLALRWTARNISRFGGDPNRIYLMGHSKGAESVMALLESGVAGTNVQGAIAMSGIRHFAPGANRFIPAGQNNFAPGEKSWDWKAVLNRRGVFMYVPELPVIVEKRSDDHLFSLLVTAMYGESFGAAPATAYCAYALAMEQLPRYIEPYYFVLHPGSYEHGDEMKALFGETRFGREFLRVILNFISDGKPPARSFGGRPVPFNPSRQVTHFFPSYSLSATFADDWHETLCGDQKKYPGSQIDGKFFFLEKAAKLFGAADFRAAPFPPKPVPMKGYSPFAK